MRKIRKKDGTSDEYEVNLYTQSDIIKMISEDTQINHEIVSIIIKRYVDIIIELVASHSIVKISKLFEINPIIMRSNKRHHAVTDFDENKEIPAHVEIRIRALPTLKELHKLQQMGFKDKPGIINRDSWRGAIKWHNKNIVESRKRQNGAETEYRNLNSTKDNYTEYLDNFRSGSNKTNEIHNPMLDDDEE